ncbi:glycerophosphodiester phosphodiesterase family protein [Labrenzia sp. R4_2]|uniref:glycerophosphodiester phosphodiesterase n=1 Tax=Labrenzia sp. R4_2 TaxID=2821107 RepID=UPI001ADCCA36|nr:glycerophosphodiester phosphodiesterase family protein [Labrenzia sp. R4_2]
MNRAAIVCHRGLSLKAPENTLASLEKAIEAGAEVVELDVRPSRDGVLYVFHDDTLDRTTNGSGRFADKLASEIDLLDAGSWFSKEFSGERVPRFDAFLKACQDRIAVYAEIKEGDPAKVRDMLQANGLLETAWTFSFDQSIRAEARARVPDLRLMVLYDHVGSVERAVAQGAAILEFQAHNLDADLAASARDAGLTTQLFYDGDDRDVFELAVTCGIQQMNIDHVDVFRSVENEILTPAT